MCDNMEEPNDDWATEKQKIDRLCFWDTVSGVIGGGNQMWFFNALQMTMNFLSRENCSQPISEESLKIIAAGISPQNITKYLGEINSLLPKYDINSCLRKGHFLSQVIHESGSFQFTKELGASLSYDPWRGRGLIQITFETNYRAYGAFCGEDTYSSQENMEKLERAPHSFLSAIWYWNILRNLSEKADEDDFIAITIAINGGLNGYDHRLDALNRYIKVMSAQSCFKNNISGKYEFEDSSAYDSRRAAFAWGLWNDPGLQKKGKSKSKEEALKGYRRLLHLHESAGSPPMPANSKWYGYENPVEIAMSRINAL